MPDAQALLPGDGILLWCGTQDHGAMSSEDAPTTWQACHRLVELGLLVETGQMRHISVFHATRAGIEAMGNILQ